MKKEYTKTSIRVIRFLDFIKTSEVRAGVLEIKIADDWTE